MNTITTYSGRILDLDFIESKDVCIADIAHSLAYQCRFNGHTSSFYSVAEHSVLLADLVQVDSRVQNLTRRMAALLHDSAEAYIGDITSPVRRLGFFNDGCEDTIRKTIFDEFYLPNEALTSDIKEKDRLLTIIEGQRFLPNMYWQKEYVEMRAQHEEFFNMAEGFLAVHCDSREEWENPERVYCLFRHLLTTEWGFYLREIANAEIA